MIKIRNITKSFGKNEVLKNVNATFEPGKVYGVVGRNGAGKTTLFNSVLGLESHSGQVEYSNGNLKDVTGYLPTNPQFISKLTGKEYLQLMCHARDIKIESFTAKNIFNLPLHQYAETYSTGMKKKLAFTGILLQKNKVFILDEPFNGVDVHSNLLISDIIQHLKKQNKIVLLSSHMFSTLKELCDTIFYLEDGNLSPGVGEENFADIEAKLRGDKDELNLNALEL